MKKFLSWMLTLVMVLSLCSFSLAESYTASATGFGGDVIVTLTLDGNRITDVQIVGDSETAGVGSNALTICRLR